MDINSDYMKCVEPLANQVNKDGYVWVGSFIVAVALPALFFGGSAFLKYIFPVKKGKS